LLNKAAKRQKKPTSCIYNFLTQFWAISKESVP